MNKHTTKHLQPKLKTPNINYSRTKSQHNDLCRNLQEEWLKNNKPTVLENNNSCKVYAKTSYLGEIHILVKN